MKDISRAGLVGAWSSAVLVMAAFSIVWGARLTASLAELWLAVFVVPPVVMLLVWRNGVAPATVAELLYDVNRDSKQDRPWTEKERS